MNEGSAPLFSAVSDFRRARNRAILKEIIARFKGESTELLSYEEVRQKLKILGRVDVGLKEVPLDAIIGSLGRYTDFTRDFLPRGSVDETRWARIKQAATGMVGLPPIEVYQIGEVYFVRDGNHRVSVARELGATHIQAYVTEIRTRVPLTPDIRPDDLILKAEYSNFLERTRLDGIRPDANLSVTIPGQYPILEEHISVHRYFMGIDQKRFIPYDEAVAHWYDTVYLPVVQLIREWGILRNFPNRTETDLYLWIAAHRAELENQLGWELTPEEVIRDLVQQFGSSEADGITRLGEKLRGTSILRKFEPGPPVGHWREETLATHPDSHLFSDILVPVNGEENGWHGLDQAILIAYKEGAHLHGLHVVPLQDQQEGEAALAVKDEFDRRCKQAGVLGSLSIVAGEVTDEICSRARWTDLIVTNLAYPPPPQPLARLDSGFRDLIQRSPNPIMAVPQTTSSLDRALLAYDGSPKAEEALFVATYLAGQWMVDLVVLTILENNRVDSTTLQRARKYLEDHGVQATFMLEKGRPSETILQAAENHSANFLIMGGYGFNPVLEIVLGSEVDQVLRTSSQPMLICR